MSIQADLVTTNLRLARVKENGEIQPEEILAGTFKITNEEPTEAQRQKFSVESSVEHGCRIWKIGPRIPTSEQHVLYLHGGAYVNGFASQHWSFVFKVVKETGCTVIAPEYPLAPASTIRETVKWLLPFYRLLIERIGSSRLTVMGDSAGGGLALILAQQAFAFGIAQPKILILISPWLDASLSNPEIPELDRVDPFLSARGLKGIASIVAGDVDLKDPILSPLYGDLKNLAPITMFIGTHDLLLADCQKLRDRASAEGVRLDYHEAEKMVHVYAILKIPEATEPMRIISDLISAPSLISRRSFLSEA